MGNVKIRIGAMASSKIMAKQYEPIEVSSSIEIEREIKDENVDEYIKTEQEKLDNYVVEDAKKKMKKMYQEFGLKKDKLMNYLGDK